MYITMIRSGKLELEKIIIVRRFHFILLHTSIAITHKSSKVRFDNPDLWICREEKDIALAIFLAT